MLRFLKKIFGCFHDWGKWESFADVNVYNSHDRLIETGLVQKRQCSKCHKVQHRKEVTGVF